MKARKIHQRELNKIEWVSDGNSGYARYYAHTNGEGMVGYEVITTGVLQAGDYYYQGINKTGKLVWVQVLGIRGREVSEYGKACRPIKKETKSQIILDDWE